MEYDVDKWDLEDMDDIFKPLNKKNKKDVEMARDYCDEHEFHYTNHTCEPTWKRGGDLDIYVVTLHKNKTTKLKFIKERNKK
jgi:hypothetical protein